jgi:hypothetical protein
MVEVKRLIEKADFIPDFVLPLTTTKQLSKVIV